MASVEEKEKRIKEAFDEEDIPVSVETREDSHNRNLVHTVSTRQDGEEYTGQIVSSFEKDIGQEKLDFLVQSFPYSSEDAESEDADEVYGDTEDIE